MTPPTNPTLTVIIATRDRKESLERCLQSVYASGFSSSFEVVVVVNGPCENTSDFLAIYSGAHPNLKYFETPKSTLGGCRNYGITKALGEILYFIDDDVAVPPGLFDTAGGLFKANPDVDLVGGPNLTPAESTRFQRWNGYVLESYFGAARMSHRYTKRGKTTLADERNLILCNLAVRSATLKKSNIRFNEKVIRNEENILMQIMKLKGHRMLYCPDLVVYHQRRRTLQEFVLQLYLYGRGRMQNIIELPKTIDPIFFLPSLLALDILLFAILRHRLFIVPIMVYVVADMVSATLKSLREGDLPAFFALLFLFPISHLSYGLGFMVELLKNVRRIVFGML